MNLNPASSQRTRRRDKSARVRWSPGSMITLLLTGVSMTRIFFVVWALALTGCGAAKIDEHADARAEYQKSLDEYQACIDSNLKNLEKCEQTRVLMETNGRTYNNNPAGSKQRTNSAGTTQGANTANTPQATSSQAPALQAASSQMPTRTPPTPQQTVTAEPKPLDIRPTPADTFLGSSSSLPGQARGGAGRRSAAKMLTRDEARRITARCAGADS
jgi:hypothetical protein